MKQTRIKKPLVLVAMLLMVAMVIGMGAMTYARYITTKTSTNQATVAKWGYVITVNANEMFGTDYTKADTASATVAGVDAGVDVSALADTEGNVVAPGTSGSMTIEINGQAEVLSQISIDVTAATDISLTPTGGTVYNPIKWTLEKNNEEKVTNGTLAAVKTALESLYTATTAAGTQVEDTITISWAWAFEQGNDDEEKAQNNAYDTILGNFAANKDYYTANNGVAPYSAINTELSFDLTVTVEQVQA